MKALKFLCFFWLLIESVISPAAAVHYVDKGNPNPSAPYTSWATAAVTIQDAVDASVAGDEVVVTNGIYDTGGRAVFGIMTNRVTVDKSLKLRSANGPQFTLIKGYQVPGSTNADGAIRCVYLTNGAILDGFTLTNGATLTGSFGPPAPLGGGGGVWCESGNALITNCWLVSNSAWSGGGAYNGTLVNCELRGNTATGSQGTYYGGGGAAWATLRECKLFYNSTASIGGGALICSLSDCLVCSNSASYPNGGGVYGGTLNNCTVVGNVGVGAFGYYAGHSGELCALNNCIVYFNDENWYSFAPLYTFTNCCTTPLPTSGSGHITADPLFADLAAGNLHLMSTSPCINAGNNGGVFDSTDFDGNPRIRDGTVDIGAYEFQYGASSIAPQLGIVLSGQTINLSWPLWASNFVLQSASGIAPNANGWSPVDAPVTTTEQENRSSLLLDGSTKFFRLLVP